MKSSRFGRPVSASAIFASVMSVSDPASRVVRPESSVTAAPRQRIHRIRAVAMKHAVFAFVVAAPAREIRVERVLDARAVLVMKAREPLVGMRADLLFVVPEQRFPPRRPVHFVRRDIPVPETVVRAAHGDRVPFFALVQIGHGPFVREMRVDAGERHREIDRLGDVVVCAEAERFDDVGAFASGRSP